MGGRGEARAWPLGREAKGKASEYDLKDIVGNGTPDFLRLSAFSEGEIKWNTKRLKIQMHTQRCWHHVMPSAFQEITAPWWTLDCNSKVVNNKGEGQKACHASFKNRRQKSASYAKEAGKGLAPTFALRNIYFRKQNCREVHWHLKSKQISSTHQHWGKKKLSGFKNQLKLKVLTCNMVSISPTKITDKMAHFGNSSKP